jgi:hypothetical protein
MDDTGNLYGRAASAVAVVAPDTLVVHANWAEEDRPGGWDWQAERRWYRPGDLILLIDPDTGEASSLAAVTEVLPHTWNDRPLVALRLDAPLPDGLKTRESLGHTKLISSSANYLTHDPAQPVEHFAINLSVKCDGFVIRDCHMGRNTVTAWKIKASNGLFLNNRFEQHGWCCISLFMELMWQEGFAPRNILIEGNTFENRFGVWTGCGYPRSGETIGPAWLRGITIRGNEFRHGPDGWSVRVNHLADGTITGNRMPVTAVHPVGARGATRGVRVSDNFYGVRRGPLPLVEPGASGVEVGEFS